MNACLICGSERSVRLLATSDRLYLTTESQFSVVRCCDCGLLRLDPQPSPDELGRYYPANYWFAPDQSAASRLEEAYRRLVLRDHLRFVTQALGGRRSGPLLDVGCGGGLFLGMMRLRGFRVVGLDISCEAAAIAWRRQQVPAICGDLQRWPLRAASFAGITMFHVLEHLPDPRSFLSAAHHLLECGGKLIVQVPNAACWQFRLLGHAWNGLDVPRHLFDFRDSDLVRLVESCGFEVIRRKYFSLRDNPAGLASSLAPSLDPMARRLRRVAESPAGHLARDLVYFALALASLPLTALEAACRAGSTVMIEAVKR